MSAEEVASAVTALADEVVWAWFDADPLRASLLGVHDRAGELPDLSGAAERAVAERMRGLAEAAGRIADPGQALAYMVGRLEIQRMRAEAEHRLGDRFDIRSFHDTVLGSGSLSLPVLAGLVDHWVGTRET